MKRIPLGHRLFASVDDEDFWVLGEYRWRAIKYGKSKTKAYAVRWTSEGVIYMHKEILGVAKQQMVDHIDGNPLNNCRANLRCVTSGENRMNVAEYKNNSYEGVPGVYYEDRVKMWRARISAKGKTHYLGYFATYGEAVDARRAAEPVYHGPFARGASGQPPACG